MKAKRWLVPAAGLPIVVLLAFGLTRNPRIVESPLEKGLAPAFALQTLDGDTLRLEDLRGQPVVLNVWASWCLACIGEHPLLVEASKTYGPQGLRIVGLVYQDNKDNALAWMQDRGGDWKNVLDPGSRTAIEYGLLGVPETFFIGRDGRILHKQIGPITPQVLAEWIPKLMASTTVAASNDGAEP
jgi:cytochrome c biogenesis protein CcmG/thiol:disulfide interchange protein DsbE